MKEIKKMLALMGVGAAMMLTGCDASVGGLLDADDATSDTTQGTDTTIDTNTDTTTPPTEYKSIVIFDKSEDPVCTKSPGMDFDAIGAWRGNTFLGVGRVGSANIATSGSKCPDNDKNIPSSAEGPVNGKVFADKPDTGYVSLNGGSLELEIGACTNGASTAFDCDGKGALVALKSGDELDIYEVDTTYKPGSGSDRDGFAYSGCACYADEFTVNLRTAKGVDFGSVFLPSTGFYKGTTGGAGAIVVP